MFGKTKALQNHSSAFVWLLWSKYSGYVPRFIHSQEFPFKSSLMNYIFKNASPEIFTKFNKTCKYIFAKFQLIPVKYLPCLIKKESNANFWLTEILECDKMDKAFYKTRIPKIARCNLKILILRDCANFMFKEFMFLTESGNLELMQFVRTMVVFPNNLPVPMEHLMSQALKATSIIIQPCHVTSETMKILCSQKRQALMSCFYLSDIDNSLDPHLLFQFVLKEIPPNKFKYMGFEFNNKDVDNQFQLNFQNFLKANGYISPV